MGTVPNLAGLILAMTMLPLLAWAGEGGSFVLINMTPYNWNQIYIHSYQMNAWGFPQSVPAGSMAKVYVEWDQSIFDDQEDDGGQVIYQLQGAPISASFQLQASATTTSFNLQAYYTNIATTSHPLGSVVDLGWVHDGNTVFVLSGVPGLLMNTINPPTNWMQLSLPTVGNKPLRQLVIPGSHDSGMSLIDGSTFFGDDADHVLTQTLSVGGQLANGARYFDLRPVISSGIFKTGHYSTLPVVGYQGANGESFSQIISEINAFTSVNAELIILNLSHDLNTDSGYGSLTQANWNQLFQQLSGLSHLYVAPNPTTIDLSTLPLSQFIGQGSAAVIVLVDAGDTTVTLGSYASRGFYNSTTQFPLFDSYANTNDLSTLESDQLTKLAQNRTSWNSSEFLLSWTLTQQPIDFTQKDAPSIIDYANQANNDLFTALPPVINRNLFPNILYIDNFNRTDVTALAIGINDYNTNWQVCNASA
ncbi:hypothetical protein EW026_g6133 [Hermanssonia centrifuga]|uniref:PLC-like phosphodiesterase n=1 Tax=Hermanssonia centrifuga TaxID=98765 RepID=A0A4S4KGC7_9APHY|nr:hypothetical protein EW026_g6133 [Hermanssonia centrifuga]